MGSTLMATTSMLICTGLGAVISSTYSVKNVINDTIFGAHSDFMVGLKYAIILAILLFSFLFHTFSIGFLNQVNILICTPQDVKSLVTLEYLTQLLDKAIILNTVGNMLFYSALPLLLWPCANFLIFDGNGNYIIQPRFSGWEQQQQDRGLYPKWHLRVKKCLDLSFESIFINFNLYTIKKFKVSNE